MHEKKRNRLSGNRFLCSFYTGKGLRVQKREEAKRYLRGEKKRQYGLRLSRNATRKPPRLWVLLAGFSKKAGDKKGSVHNCDRLIRNDMCKGRGIRRWFPRKKLKRWSKTLGFKWLLIINSYGDRGQKVPQVEANRGKENLGTEDGVGLLGTNRKLENTLSEGKRSNPEDLGTGVSGKSMKKYRRMEN